MRHGVLVITHVSECCLGEAYLATVAVGFLESIKSSRAQTLTSRFLILGRSSLVGFEWGHCAYVRCRILFI